MNDSATYAKDAVYKVLETVKDPEIPVISIVDLGIVRDVHIEDARVSVDLTPTYSGCPALDVIPILVKQALDAAGYDSVEVKNVLSPPWTTDWISEKGRERLRAFGISPPEPVKTSEPLESRDIPCPRCGSTTTQLISRFGSTPCKAAYQCEDCLEPFDYFKCH